jgi:hypothetical protein
MNAFEQLQALEETAKHTYCPALLFAINKRANELKEDIERIKKMTVYICQN